MSEYRTNTFPTLARLHISKWICAGNLTLLLLGGAFNLGSSSELSAAERPNLSGLVFPQPKHSSALEAQGKRRWPTNSASADLLFELDKKGKVKKLNIDCLPRDSAIFYPFMKSLKSLRFLAAEYQDKNISFQLQGILTIRNRRSLSPELLLPVNHAGLFRSPQLAEGSAELNGFHFARVNSFPSYFFVSPSIAEDTGKVPALALLRIALDASGAILTREIVYSTDPDVGDIALTASGWADFQPATFKGKAIPSSLLVAVRFFTELDYPTGRWNGAPPVESGAFLEYQRVRSFADMPVIILEPEIRLKNSELISVGLDTTWRSVNAAFLVEKNGSPKLKRITDAGFQSPSERLRNDLKNMRMYPALSFRLSGDGEFIGFDTLFSSGSIYLRALDTLRLRATTSFHTQLPALPIK